MEYKVLKYTVVNRIDLGRTRIAGYTLYNPANASFMEMTPGQVKNLIRMKQVNGLKLEKDEIVLDPDFGQDNLIIKSGVGNYRQLIEMPDRPHDLMLSLTKPITDPDTKENVYEVVTNLCARVCITEEAMFHYVRKGMVAGCDYIMDENNKMKLLFCDGVDTSDYNFKEETDELSDAEKPDCAEPAFDNLPDADTKEENGNVFDELLAECEAETEQPDETVTEQPEDGEKPKAKSKSKSKKTTTKK